ncbi:MAG: maltotransferase domain-containing protein, partial [Dermabacter sp.]|nr:maltotransferase domain-containing protein [Dermabacter sp.]
MATKAKAAMTTGIGRIPITSVSPNVDGGRFPVKAVVGERFRVHATSFREGHDQMGVQLLGTNPE